MHRIAAIVVVLLWVSSLALAEPRQKTLVDFDDPAVAKIFSAGPSNSKWEIVTDHATVGKHAFKCTVTTGWVNFMDIAEASDPSLKNVGYLHTSLKEVGNYRTLALDIYNDSNVNIHMYAKIFDNLSLELNEAKKDVKAGRFQTDWLVCRPGKSTLRFSLTALPRMVSPLKPEYGWSIDSKNLKRIWLFTKGPGEGKKPYVFYVGGVRLEDSGVELPEVEGLKAFCFGPSNHGPFPSFVNVTEQNKYDAKTGCGWQGQPQVGFGGYPDELTSRWALGTFIANLKPGKYIVQTALDPTGQWGWSNNFRTRSLKLNGKEVLAESMDGMTFLKTRFCLFENEDDTPGMNVWKDRVSRINPIRQFEAEVGADGKLTVNLSPAGMSGGMCFLVAYPKDKAKEGQAYMDALDVIRKERFDSKINLGVPLADGPAPTPTAAEKARGFIAFVRSSDKPLNCMSVASADELAGMKIQACAGERTCIQLGLYPLSEVTGLKITASDLKGPGGASIPASAFDLKRVRHYWKRYGWGTYMELIPLVHLELTSLDLKPGFTQPVWVNFTVPAGTSAGDYKGVLKLIAGNKVSEVPVTVSVNPFTLEQVAGVSISGMNTSGGNFRMWYSDLGEHWWNVAEKVIAMQAEHGFTALTGGPTINVKSIANNKAQIDFNDADRWMALARKYHLTQLGDSYQGFDAAGNFRRDQSVNCMNVNDSWAQRSYKMSFSNVVKAVYGAIAEHAAEKNWPERAFYLLDEPGPDRVKPVEQLIALHKDSAPGVRFSGYYAPSNPENGNRDSYYNLLGLSILSSYDGKILQTIHDAGNKVWTYANPNSGSGLNFRFIFGNNFFVVNQLGLDGITEGFYYCNTIPYWDITDNEGSWGLVYPSIDTVNSTLWFEQVAMGINDYRYLKTLTTKMDACVKAGKNVQALEQAQQLLDRVKKTRQESKGEAVPWFTPEEYADFRQQETQRIIDLQK